MEIDYINGKKTTNISGISKYQKEIHSRLKNVELNVIEYTSLLDMFKRTYTTDSLPVPRNNNLDISSKFENIAKYQYSRLSDLFIEAGKKVHEFINKSQYLCLVKTKTKKGNVKHITSQEFAYLLEFLNLEKTIVTCYDLIPWIYDKNRSFFWRLNMKDLKKADRMITCAEYSKRDIIKYLGYPEDKIHVVYPAVDHNIYYKKRNKEILRRYGILNEQRVILYVGSETPRQNVPLLVNAFGRLKKMLPDVKLVKIGRPQWTGAREKLLKLVEELSLQSNIILIDNVVEEDLPKWYNAVDLFVFPGLYAGVSMPCLEAITCGTPVISCPVSIAMERISYLPEDLGDAGMLVDPHDTDELAKAMYEVLTNDGLREDMIKKGLERAKKLSWDMAAKETLKVYEEVYSS